MGRNDISVPLAFPIEDAPAFPELHPREQEGVTYLKVMFISDREGEMSLWALLALQLFKCFAYNTITDPSSDYWHY